MKPRTSAISVTLRPMSRYCKVSLIKAELVIEVGLLLYLRSKPSSKYGVHGIGIETDIRSKTGHGAGNEDVIRVWFYILKAEINRVCNKQVKSGRKKFDISVLSFSIPW